VKTLSAQEVTVRPEDVKDLELKPLLEIPAMAPIITGHWKNQLGSTVHFDAKESGELHGEYLTAVGNVVKKHPLHGSWCSVREGGALLSFTVAWTNLKSGASKRSTTAWSGRLYMDPLEIVTTWTLTSEKPKKDQWKSVLINKDVFTKAISQ